MVSRTRQTSASSGPGEAVTAFLSEDSTAGGYGRPDLDALGSGWYYTMFTAPRDHRLSRNVLPLARALMDAGFGWACIPRVGKRLAYLAEIKRGKVPGSAGLMFI